MMQVFNTLPDWQTFRATFAPNQRVGFVPTMGNLHPGHLSLIKASQQENDKTIVSVFVNPTQFNNPDDFTYYPRTLDADLTLLQNAGVDYCLMPTEAEMYPDDYCYQIEETKLARIMEGQHRPGHFTGVLTVVMKLLQLTRPTTAYFGEKDFQQFLLIQQMAKAFFLPTTIKACPIIREASGLAYSSRNNRLSADERCQAEQFAQCFQQGKAAGKSTKAIQQQLETQGIDVEYLEEYAGRLFIAVMIGNIRLIDNR